MRFPDRRYGTLFTVPSRYLFLHLHMCYGLLEKRKKKIVDVNFQLLLKP